MPLIIRINCSQVLLKFTYRYVKGPGFLLDKNAFEKLVGISVEDSPG